ncbi:hybrid sensor histidine kinase/response regulator [Echinicola sediminis]
MKKRKTTRKARQKVIIGFLLAIFLVLSVSAVTYFSLDKLLNTVESLSEPSERIQQLNALLADVYQLDKVKGNFNPEGDSTVAENYLDLIEGRLNYLEQYANDTAEQRHLKQINFNINELVVVYNGLRDVKENLINRNFSREALKNLETKIKRQEEINRLQSLGRIRFDHKIRRTNRPNTGFNGPKKVISEENARNANLMTAAEMENLKDAFQQFRPQLDPKDTLNKAFKTDVDSVLYTFKSILLDINYQEKELRSKLADLEGELNQKNKALIAEIQSVISILQKDALKEVQEKNSSLYDLAFDVSILLGVLIFVGVVGSSAFIYSILTEINKEANYRDELEKAKERSDKLAKAKQNFLANMSHEIRNPLHTIQGYNAAIKKTKMSPDQEDYVNMVGFAAETLSGIVNDILDLSKLEAGKIAIENIPFDPHKLFMSIKSSFELKAAEKRIDFNWKLDLPRDKWLEGDELRISQILNNLISNALKFTEKGKVEVSIGYDEKGFLLMKVEDTGIGMTDEFKENVFQEFNQGDGSINRRYGGTGLGLAIVKRMLDLQKGEVLLDSTKGEGTTVSIKIPAKMIEAQYEAVEEVGTYVDISHLKVLLVDDDSVGLKFAKLLLESNGAEVTDYLGGIKVKEEFEEKSFDIMLIDIQMPEVSGYDVLRILKQRDLYKDVPAVAITANVFAKETDKISEAGFDSIVLKPFKEEQLLQEIGRVLKLEAKESLGITPPVYSADINEECYDTSDLRKFCMNDEEMLKDVLTDFCATTSQDLVDLGLASKSGDLEQLLEVSHKLGSRLGQLKIKTGTLARGLEYDLKEGNISHTDEVVRKIKADTLQVLDRILEDYQLLKKVG